jgi:hypothetical protein
MAEMTSGGLFDGAADGWVLVPEGTYDAVVKKAEFQQSAMKGKPQVVATFALQGGPNDGNTVRTWLTYTPASESDMALSILKRQLTALLGEQMVASLAQADNAAVMMEKVAEVLPGRPCRVKVAVEKYQEEDRNIVKAILPPTAQAAGQAAATDPFATAAAPVAQAKTVTTEDVATDAVTPKLEAEQPKLPF